jgi:2-haloacid dehalogenase
MKQIKVLAFDTGGTVLDWHAGLTAAMAAWGTAQGIERDWHALANEYRRRSLRRMTGTVDPGFNIDDVHRDVLGEVFDENGLGGSPEDRRAIAERWHQLDVVGFCCGAAAVAAVPHLRLVHDPQPVADR